MSKELHFSTPCCTFCELCPSYQSETETSCNSCVHTNGKPYWGECKIYECTQKKKIDHCGLCDIFPCNGIINNYDEKNPRGPHNAVFRLGQQVLRKKLGTEEWLKKCSDNSIPPKN